LGKVHVKNFWPKKLRKKNLFPVVFSHRFFFIAFLAVSLHEEPKNTIKIFSKIKPENRKKSQKSRGGGGFFGAPLGPAAAHGEPRAASLFNRRYNTGGGGGREGSG
jgi:hypothetical protein